MIVLGYDLESTGLDTTNDNIIEIGAIIYDTKERAPLEMLSCFVRPQRDLPDDYISPTGIRKEWLFKYGLSMPEAFGRLQKMISNSEPLCVAAHNGENFDKPLTLAELLRHNIVGHSIESMHWIDTRNDIPFKKEPASRSLVNLAAEHGYLNPFPHRAVFDVATMLKLLDFYDFPEILEESKKPWVTMRALVNFDTRQKAKDLRFTWDGTRQIWTKKVKENLIEREIENAKLIGVNLVKI